MIGRPEFKPTPAQRKKVEQCISCGMTKENTARAIGIAVHTMEKHFAEELATAPARMRSAAIALLWQSAEKGNVAAQKKLVELTTIGEAHATLGATLSGPPSHTAMGKKEERQRAAQTAADGTPWDDILNDDAPLPN